MKKLTCFLLLISSIGYAQQYVAEAPLPSISKEGFFSIPLPPGITGLLEADYRNIRILDEQNKEVPYILQVEERRVSKNEFVEYKMEKEQRAGCCTILTFNNERIPISSVVLLVRNAQIVKEATMHGSDDKQSWYALKDEFHLAYGNMNSTKVVDLLDFPVSNYAYYRVVINDSTTAPLNIISAGYFKNTSNNGEYVELPSVTITSADSTKDRTTWAAIRFDNPEFIDKIEFEVSGPPFYHRGATLFERDSKYLNPVSSFDITSKQPTSIDLTTKARELVLRTSNESNQPLQFKGVRAWQLKRSLTAWLEQGHTYKIIVGSDSLRMPVYDLEFFRDSIPEKPVVLEVGDITKFARPVVVEAASPTYFTNRNIIWVAIILVAVILGAMSMKMIRENSKN